MAAAPQPPRPALNSEAVAPARPPALTSSTAPGRCSALRSALQVASTGLLPVPQGALDQEEAGCRRPAGQGQVSAGPAVQHFVAKIVVAHGERPWESLCAGLRGLDPVTSGRWAVEDVSLSSLVVRPVWDGECGFAGMPAALEAGRSILRMKPALLLIAPGLSAAREGIARSAAWPRGRVDLPAGRKSELHTSDLVWAAVAALLDAVLEVAAEGLPAPSFALLLPEAFASARGRLRVEPWLEARLDALARLPEVRTGAFYQCDWAHLEAASEPQRVLTDLPFLADACHEGLPVLRAKRGARDERCYSYCGPLPGSCACGVGHRRRSAEEAAAADPLEPGTAERLVGLIDEKFDWKAARPAALVGGELAAFALLSGPPCRGPPVPPAGAGRKGGWRPLDLYIGRNNRYGGVAWGNHLKSAKTGTRPAVAAFLRRSSGAIRGVGPRLRI